MSQLCVSAIDSGPLESGRFPGRHPREDLRICIAPGAHAAMHSHAKSSLDREVCGVLLGGLRRDGNGPFLMIDDVIEASEAQGEAARVTFTPVAWQAIFKEQEQRDPGLKMVGWYHTHPRFGIFLSHYDRFIHENFFNVQPWMVAFVIDPCADEEAFFHWRSGKIVRTERHWIGDMPRKADGAELDGIDLVDDHSVDPARKAPAAAAPMPERPAAADASFLPLKLESLLLVGFVAMSSVVFFQTCLPRSSDASTDKLALYQRELLLTQGELAAEILVLRRDLGLTGTRREALERLAEIHRKLLEAEARQSGDTAVVSGQRPSDSLNVPGDSGRMPTGRDGRP